MKIAILVSGLLRTFNEKLVFSSFVENLLIPLKENVFDERPTEIRLFFNLGVSSSLEEEVEISQEAFAHLFDSGTIDLSIHKFTYNSKPSSVRPHTQFHQLYGIQKGFEHIMSHDKRWVPDLLIRTRPDFVCMTPFKNLVVDDDHLFCLVKSDTPHKAHDCFFYMSRKFYESVWKAKAIKHLLKDYKNDLSLEYCFINKKFESSQIQIIDSDRFKGGLKRKDVVEPQVWE